MNGLQIPKQRLKLRNSFLKGTTKLNMTQSKSEVSKSLNRLITGVGRYKVNMKRWGLLADRNTTCSCGQEQRTSHLLVCSDCMYTCFEEDFIQANQKDIDVVQY